MLLFSLHRSPVEIRAPRRSAAAVAVVITLAGCASTPKPEVELREPSPGEVVGMRYELAERLVQRRQYGQAAPFVRDLLKHHPKDAKLHLLLGIVLREQGVYDAAERELRWVIAREPSWPQAYTAVAVLMSKRRRLAAAEKLHRKAVALAPDEARYHNDLGFCLLLQRKLRAAREELQEAVRLDPTIRHAFNNLGFTLGLLGEKKQALRAFRQAGSTAMAWTNLGFVAQLRGRPLRARRYYERALRHRHDFAPALRNLRALQPNHDMIHIRSDEGSSSADVDSEQAETTGLSRSEIDESKDRPRQPQTPEGSNGADRGDSARSSDRDSGLHQGQDAR